MTISLGWLWFTSFTRLLRSLVAPGLLFGALFSGLLLAAALFSRSALLPLGGALQGVPAVRGPGFVLAGYDPFGCHPLVMFLWL